MCQWRCNSQWCCQLWTCMPAFDRCDFASSWYACNLVSMCTSAFRIYRANNIRLGARGVQFTFHQSLLNRNVTAITANLMLGSWIRWFKHILFHCISQKWAKYAQMSQNWGELVARIGFVKGFWENLSISNLHNLLKQVSPCFEVGILLERFIELGRCVSLSKSSALPLSKLRTAMYGN